MEGSGMKYEDFVSTKLSRNVPTGIAGAEVDSPHLSPFQRDLVRWALRRGRAALFADTGLGKTRMELEWARQVNAQTGSPVLILAPLAVAEQTAREGAAIGIPAQVVRDGSEVTSSDIYVTNYERLHRFDPARFGGVVIDESSCIKHHDAKTFGQLVEAFSATPFRLACSATPAPNDYTELGTHAEFLGLCTRLEMLSEYFLHDGGNTASWRLKGHARAGFWHWVATWAALVRTPSDLGYLDDGYVLPPLTVEHHVVAADAAQVKAAGTLFALPAQALMERRTARRASLDARVQLCSDLVNGDDEPWVVWCDLNDESGALGKLIRGAVEVRGSQSIEEKEAGIVGFSRGEHRVIVSKGSICGWGVNWQHCNRVAFVGVTDSWEAYYQSIRRCWRFGQKRPVQVHVFASELEGEVIANLQRKEADARRMADELSVETRDAVREAVKGGGRMTNNYEPRVRMRLPAWMEGR